MILKSYLSVKNYSQIIIQYKAISILSWNSQNHNVVGVEKWPSPLPCSQGQL